VGDGGDDVIHAMCNQDGVMDRLLSALRTHMSVPNVVRAALGLIRALSGNDANKSLLCRYACVYACVYVCVFVTQSPTPLSLSISQDKTSGMTCVCLTVRFAEMAVLSF
jgi:hypothetical protein